MPWLHASVPAQLLLSYRGVSVYHTYPEGDFCDGPREFTYSTEPDDEEMSFDIRELQLPRRPSWKDRVATGLLPLEATIQTLKEAVDAGVLVASGTIVSPQLGTPEQRSDEEIVSETNQLARALYGLRGYEVKAGYRFDRATHPHEREAWEGACEAQRQLRDTDPEDALANLEG